MSSKVTTLPTGRSGPRAVDTHAMSLEEIRALVRTDLAGVDAMIRARLKSAVPLVDQVAEHIIGGGGKRLRPLLCVLSGRACGIQSDKHIEAAAFIEFVHTATLLHDDVVDGSQKRRGRATANNIFGNQASVLVGDFVYSRAYQLIDDVLDYKSDPATRGKNLGDDLSEGKPTLPLLHALRHGNDEQRALIRLAIEQGGLAQLGPIVDAIETTGGLDYAIGFAQRETAQALAALQGLPESQYSRGLGALARLALERTS